MIIEPGALIYVDTMTGKRVTRRAITGVVMGHDFPVVWACIEDEWQAAAEEQREPEGIPWPAEDVKPAQIQA